MPQRKELEGSWGLEEIEEILAVTSQSRGLGKRLKAIHDRQMLKNVFAGFVLMRSVNEKVRFLYVGSSVLVVLNLVSVCCLFHSSMCQVFSTVTVLLSSNPWHRFYTHKCSVIR